MYVRAAVTEVDDVATVNSAVPSAPMSSGVVPAKIPVGSVPPLSEITTLTREPAVPETTYVIEVFDVEALIALSTGVLFVRSASVTALGKAYASAEFSVTPVVPSLTAILVA